MKKAPKKMPGGWFDWQVIIAMILFVLLMLCSLYSEAKLLKYLAIIPALFVVIRTFAGVFER